MGYARTIDVPADDLVVIVDAVGQGCGGAWGVQLFYGCTGQREAMHHTNTVDKSADNHACSIDVIGVGFCGASHVNGGEGRGFLSGSQ